MRRALRPALAMLAAGLALVAPATATASRSEDRAEVRVSRTCGNGASARLRLRAERGAIRVDLRVEYARRAAWRAALVHERRVAWKGRVSSGRSGSLELRRTLRDFPGADAVTVRVWGPGGLSCSVTARLPATA